MTIPTPDELKKAIPKVVKMNLNEKVAVLEELLEMAKSGELESFIFAGFDNEGMLISDQAHLDVMSQQQLVSYLQTETTLRTMIEFMGIQAFVITDPNDDPEE